jgi:isoleucyl-tRNA synthetase
LSNLNDFSEADLLPADQLNELDFWILTKLNQLIEQVTAAYNEFEFHQVTYKLHDFCAVTLSALYLDMIKDRLYCDGKNSQTRRSTQTAIYYLTDSLVRLMAPILVFTAEDIYSFFNKQQKESSIHLTMLPQVNPAFNKPELMQKFDKLLEIKNAVYQKLEELRNNKTIRSFLETKVELTLPEIIDFNDWASFLIVSQVEIKQGPELQIIITKLDEKCDRCWKYLPLTNGICTRCSEAINMVY